MKNLKYSIKEVSLVINKKILSLLMTLICALSLFSFSAYAEEVNPYEDDLIVQAYDMKNCIYFSYKYK